MEMHLIGIFVWEKSWNQRDKLTAVRMVDGYFVNQCIQIWRSQKKSARSAFKPC